MDVQKIQNKFIFSPNSIEEVISYMKISTETEFSTEKPGNVGPNQSISKISYNDYQKISNLIDKAAKSYFSAKISHDIKKSNSDIPEEGLGFYIYSSVKSMVESPPYQNLLLGQILLYAPLLFTTKALVHLPINSKKRNWSKFWSGVGSVIGTSELSDAIWLVRAIILSKAGGLDTPGGKPLKTRYNVKDIDIESRIQREECSMLDLFRESESFDSISEQYSTNFKFCREIFKNWLVPNIKHYPKLSDLTLSLFLEILSTKPDSLIYRKNDFETALNIQKSAQQIKNAGGLKTKIGQQMISELNREMIKENGKLNPGTTADLTACILFLGFMFGILHRS
jgi:triphosphoribosyl-dephospho-CoA synthase